MRINKDSYFTFCDVITNSISSDVNPIVIRPRSQCLLFNQKLQSSFYCFLNLPSRKKTTTSQEGRKLPKHLFVESLLLENQFSLASDRPRTANVRLFQGELMMHIAEFKCAAQRSPSTTIQLINNLHLHSVSQFMSASS